jgi:hypothetical protein
MNAQCRARQRRLKALAIAAHAFERFAFGVERPLAQRFEQFLRIACRIGGEGGQRRADAARHRHENIGGLRLRLRVQRGDRRQRVAIGAEFAGEARDEGRCAVASADAGVGFSAGVRRVRGNIRRGQCRCSPWAGSS